MPGLVMRRAADLYPGQARHARGRYVLADTARVPDARIAWLEVTDEVLKTAAGAASGSDDDLPADVVGVANRLRDILTSLDPALQRVVGNRMDHPGRAGAAGGLSDPDGH